MYTPGVLSPYKDTDPLQLGFHTCDLITLNYLYKGPIAKHDILGGNSNYQYPKYSFHSNHQYPKQSRLVVLINKLINLHKKYILNIYYVPDIAVGTGGASAIKGRPRYHSTG